MILPDKSVGNKPNFLFSLGHRDTFKQSHLARYLNIQKIKMTYLKVFLDESDLCVNPEVARQFFPDHKSVHQKVYMVLDLPVNPGVGTMLKLTGEGGQGKVLHEIQPLPFIVEEFALSRIQEHMQHITGVDNADEKFRIAWEMLVAEKLHNLAIRSSIQLRAFADANKAPNGGKGTMYATSVADYKIIPKTSELSLFSSLATEAGQNKVTQLGLPSLIGTGIVDYIKRENMKLGKSNSRDESVNDAWFNKIHIDFDLELVDPVADEGLIQSIASGGVFAKSFVHNVLNGIEIAGHSWSKFLMPQLPVLTDAGIDASKIQVGFKGFKGPVDNYANMSYEEARIDLAEGGVFWTQWFPTKPYGVDTIFNYRMSKT